MVIAPPTEDRSSWGSVNTPADTRTLTRKYLYSYKAMSSNMHPKSELRFYSTHYRYSWRHSKVSRVQMLITIL